MNLMENIRQAVAGLVHNKMRSLLTMLGIIIGIGSVIAISSVGDSMTGSVSNSLSSVGVNKVSVMLYPKDPESLSMRYETSDMFDDDKLAAYQEKFSDSLLAISLSSNIGSGKIEEQRDTYKVNVSGVNEGYALGNSAGNVEILKGRFITEKDTKRGSYVAVISQKLANRLSPTADVLGRELRVELSTGAQTFTVVGVYKDEERAQSGMFSFGGNSLSTNLYIPLTTADSIQNMYSGYYSSFTAAAKTGINYQKFATDTENFFNQRYYQKNPTIQCITQSMDSMLSQVNSMMSTMSLAISVIAGISLLVGGIGVMNIMLVSVTERTREIGIRKALGARDSAIRAQFIVESTIICIIGGILGIITGAALGYLGGMLLEQPTIPSIPSILVAVGFSMLIGVFFGYYPANKAAKLDPIEALRYE